MRDEGPTENDAHPFQPPKGLVRTFGDPQEHLGVPRLRPHAHRVFEKEFGTVGKLPHAFGKDNRNRTARIEAVPAEKRPLFKDRDAFGTGLPRGDGCTEPRNAASDHNDVPPPVGYDGYGLRRRKRAGEKRRERKEESAEEPSEERVAAGETSGEEAHSEASLRSSTPGPSNPSSHRYASSAP